MASRHDHPAECTHEHRITPLQRRMLDAIQEAFPLAPLPYEMLGRRLDITAAEAAAVVAGLRRDGIVRRIGGSFVASALGLQSTLAAARVSADCLPAVAGQAGAWPEVTHNYERTDAFNLWFTVTAADRAGLDRVLDAVRRANGVETLIELPVVRLFKLRAVFAFAHAAASDQSVDPRPATGPTAAAPGTMPFTADAADRRLILAAADDITADPRPFRRLAATAGLDEAEAIARLNRYCAAGVMRRFGAIVRHRRAGIRANGMCIWDLPDADVAALAAYLCARDDVSHCYERARAPQWTGNLYAMLHGRTEAIVRERAASIAAQAGAPAPRILFSTREFKKTSLDLAAVWS